MKKYIKPESKEVRLAVKSFIAAGSLPIVSDEEVEGNSALTKRNKIWEYSEE